MQQIVEEAAKSTVNVMERLMRQQRKLEIIMNWLDSLIMALTMLKKL